MSNDALKIKPFPSSYWVLPGKFLAGGYPGSTLGVEQETRQVLRSFLELGITSFFNLTQPEELPSYQEMALQETSAINLSVECHRFPIPDRGLPTRDQMKDLLACLDRTLAAGKRLYLHCWGGVGRTGSVVGCWLVHSGLDGRQALKHLNELYRDAAQFRIYPHSPETEEQVQFILNWGKDGLA